MCCSALPTHDAAGELRLRPMTAAHLQPCQALGCRRAGCPERRWLRCEGLGKSFT